MGSDISVSSLKWYLHHWSGST